MKPSLADVTIERVSNGEYVYSGLEVGKFIECSIGIFPHLMQQSVDGKLYPYRVHGTFIYYDYFRRVYFVLIESNSGEVIE